LSLFIIVIGGIYAGFFTATEGAGFGAVGAFVAAIIKRRFNRKSFWGAVRSAALMNGSVFHILIGAMVFSYFVTICKVPTALADLISSLTLNRYLILIIIMVIYIVLGCMMNIMPAVIITLPMIFPTITNLGFDPIWFGVMMVINMEMGQITPPVGINVYTICSVVRDVSMGTVFRGVFPFFLMMCLMLLILTLLPSLATFLPNFFMGK
jgi:tripartite ATP-independent transporter DctM subunit